MKKLSYEKGQFAELYIKEQLLCKKYTILETNFKTKNGEIDIIARDENNALRFIEVKHKISLSIEDIINDFLNRNLKNYYKIIDYYVFKKQIKELYYIDLIILDKDKLIYYSNLSQEFCY